MEPKPLTLKIEDKQCNCKQLNLGKRVGYSHHVCSHNSIKAKYPYIAAQWVYERNIGTPDDYLPGSDKKMWWKCPINPCGCHIYDSAIKHRCLNNRNCPYCENKKLCPHNNLYAIYPDLCREWDYERNSEPPTSYPPVSGKRVWWRCQESICDCHRYEAQIANRTSGGTKCPYCRNKRPCPHNNLLVLCQELSKDWDYERNIKRPEDYLPGSNEIVWWICRNDPCGCHRYQRMIKEKTSKTQECSFCTGRNICPHNNFSTTHPDLCKEWNYDKNIKGPEQYSQSSNRKVWWTCPKNPCGCHIYKSIITNRVHGNTGCPYCVNRKACPHNNLLVLYPDLCKEWDYERNIKTPDCYVPGSNEKVHWICLLDDSHKYFTSIISKTNRNNCRVCNMSSGERLVRLVLMNLNIEYEYEWIYTEMIPNKRYDFCFTYNDQVWIVEYDGIQHFEENVFFHRQENEFEYKREIDKIKTFVACYTGIKMIHIDHTNSDMESIHKHILKAFNLNNVVYYSDQSMYHCLMTGTIDPSMLQQEASGFYNKFINK